MIWSRLEDLPDDEEPEIPSLADAGMSYDPGLRVLATAALYNTNVGRMRTKSAGGGTNGGGWTTLRNTSGGW